MSYIRLLHPLTLFVNRNLLESATRTMAYPGPDPTGLFLTSDTLVYKPNQNEQLNFLLIQDPFSGYRSQC